MSDSEAEESLIYQEIEAKFRVTSASQAHALRTAPTLADEYPLGPVVDVVNVDTYYDAADLRLLRQGQTLRLRAVNDTVLMTSKSVGLHTPKGLHTRSEIERPAPELDAEAMVLRAKDLPTDLLEGVGDLLDNKTRLRPLVRLHQARAKRAVYMGPHTDALLAEFSLDDITVLRRQEALEDDADPDTAAATDTDAATDAATDAPAETWAPIAHFTTLEIELAPGGDRDALRDIALWLRAWPGVEADDQNKLQQALLALHAVDAATQAAQPNGVAEPDHRQHMAELCRTVWAHQLRVMLVNEAGVRASDDIEYVHDMRVATRRARAAGRLYAGYFKADSKQIKRFMLRLRKTGRLLGSVRDLDVALHKLEGFADAEDAENEAAVALAEAWRDKRDRAHAQLVDWLDSRKYRRFVVEFLEFCATPGAGVARIKYKAGEPPTPWQVRHVLPGLILSRYEAIRAFEVLFEEAQATGVEIPIETLHALRIECKYMRYHLEFSAPLMGPEAAALIESLKGLQEHLGNLNDASVSRALVAETQVQAESTAIADYASLQASMQEELRHSLPADLARFLAPETRRALALAIAHI